MLVYVGTTTTIKISSVPYIALKSSNNLRVSYFMSFFTVKILHSYIWEVLPIDRYVSRQVEELASEENQDTMDDRNIFKWSPGHKIDDDEQSILEEENENIEDDKEKDVDDNGIQSRESNEILINNQEMNDDTEDNLDVFYI